MARERRYLFDTTPLFSLPPCGGGLARGGKRRRLRDPKNAPSRRAQRVDLPRKRGR